MVGAFHEPQILDVAAVEGGLQLWCQRGQGDLDLLQAGLVQQAYEANVVYDSFVALWRRQDDLTDGSHRRWDGQNLPDGGARTQYEHQCQQQQVAWRPVNWGQVN